LKEAHENGIGQREALDMKMEISSFGAIWERTAQLFRQAPSYFWDQVFWVGAAAEAFKKTQEQMVGFQETPVNRCLERLRAHVIDEEARVEEYAEWNANEEKRKQKCVAAYTLQADEVVVK